jgi:hypothetical protein
VGPPSPKCNKGWVCHTLALPFTLKSIVRPKEKKKEEPRKNSNISPCENIIFIKNPLKETKISSRNII